MKPTTSRKNSNSEIIELIRQLQQANKKIFSLLDGKIENMQEVNQELINNGNKEIIQLFSQLQKDNTEITSRLEDKMDSTQKSTQDFINTWDEWIKDVFKDQSGNLVEHIGASRNAAEKDRRSKRWHRTFQITVIAMLSLNISSTVIPWDTIDWQAISLQTILNLFR